MPTFQQVSAAATALFYGYDFASIQDALYGQDIDLTLISQQESEQFQRYMTQFGKSYSTVEEHGLRKSLFLNNDKMINRWNGQEGVTHRLSHSKMSDWTDEEYQRIRNSKTKCALKCAAEAVGVWGACAATCQESEDTSKCIEARCEAAQLAFEVACTSQCGHSKQFDDEAIVQEFNLSDLPESVNWVEKGGVIPVDDVLLCAGNWALTAAAAITGSHFAKTGEYVAVSGQQCIDCNVEEGENWDNCDGGWSDDCMQYGQMDALRTMADFPYIHDQQSCKEEASQGPISVVEIMRPKLNSQEDLKAAIAQQPVVVMVDSAEDAFKFYSDGIISSGCGNATDEFLLAVGYGKDEKTGTEYYLLKNNYGENWGENGYARVAMNGDGDGNCGIQTNTMYPDTKASS